MTVPVPVPRVGELDASIALQPLTAGVGAKKSLDAPRTRRTLIVDR